MRDFNTLSNHESSDENNPWEEAMADVPEFNPERAKVISTADYEEKLRSLDPNTQAEEIEDLVNDYAVNKKDFIRNKLSVDLPLPSRLEIISYYLENSPVDTRKNLDALQEWFESDDGDEEEKKYRALVHIRVKDGGIKAKDGRHIYGTSRSYSSESLQQRIRSGEGISAEYAALSEDEKAERWKKLQESYRNEIIESNLRRQNIAKSSAASKKPESPARGSKSELSAHDENRYEEPATLPDQGPNANSPLFDEYPMDPFNTF